MIHIEKPTALLALLTALAFPLAPWPHVSARADDPATQPADDGTPDEPKPEQKDPSDLRNAIGNIGLIRGMQTRTRPPAPGAWSELVNKPYFTEPVRARKLLFFGQYEDAEAKYSLLFKAEPNNQDYIEGYTESILRRGHDSDLKRFDDRVSALTDAQRSTPRMIRLRSEALLAAGKLPEARSLLRGFVDAHTKLDIKESETLAVCILYAQVLERQAEFAAAVGIYDRILSLVEGKFPEDPQAATQIAFALYRSSTLTGTGRDKYRSVLGQLGNIQLNDGTYWPAMAIEAQILVASHNEKDGGTAVSDTMKLNPNEIQTRFLSIDHAIDGFNFDPARQQLAEIKDRTDIAEVAAYEGRLLLKERVPEKAVAPLLQALKRDPFLPDARGWLAATYYLLNDTAKMNEQIAASASTPGGTPHPRALFEAGEILREARQFPQAEKLYLQAQEAAQWWSEPTAALAQLYLETGQEAMAKAAYEKSFRIDPFNMRAVNQLTLLGILEKFATLESKTRLAPGSDKPAFIIRYDRRDEILAQLAVEWLEKIRPEVWSYFQVTELPTPTIIEFFPQHDQFGVRTTGLPWIGTVGASTGNVIAMDVPRAFNANTQGVFDWARVLRHEYTHTVTLAMTNFRIPHWLTEACACNQEQAPRDWENCQLLWQNYRAGTLFKIAELNWGFIKPKSTISRQLAYMQSQWIYDYLIATYGLPRMLDFLKCFHDGLTEAQAWKKNYGKTMEEVDKEFLVWAGQQIDSWGLPSAPLPKRDEVEAALKKDPDDKAALYNLALIMGSGGDNAGARTNLEKLLTLDPKNIAGRELMGAVLNALKEKDKAREILEQVAAEDPKRPTTLRTLGLLAMARGQSGFDDAEKWFVLLQAARPLESTSYTNLAGIYLVKKQNDKAIAQLLELERHEQKDERIPRKLADLYIDQKQLADAEQAAYRALRINPFNAINHQLMAQILVAESKNEPAIQYWTYATNLQPRVTEFWEGLADAKGAANDPPGAAAAARKALELQPNSKAAKWIK